MITTQFEQGAMIIKSNSKRDFEQRINSILDEFIQLGIKFKLHFVKNQLKARINFR